jgi:hypothetical protein
MDEITSAKRVSGVEPQSKALSPDGGDFLR